MYAAYGSNMHPEQMLARAPHSPMAGTGWLRGWRLTFCGGELGWEGALATVVEDPGSRVFVVLYDLSEDDEPGLDRWEGAELGLHRKIRVRIEPASAGPAGGGLDDPAVPGPVVPVSEEPSPAGGPVDPDAADPAGTVTGPVLAWLYVMDAFEGGLPSARYLGVLADAAEAAGAPAPYVRELRTRESRNVGPGCPE